MSCGTSDDLKKARDWREEFLALLLKVMMPASFSVWEREGDETVQQNIDYQPGR